MPPTTAEELMSTHYTTTTADQAPTHADNPVIVTGEDGKPLWIVGPGGSGPTVLLQPDDPVTVLSAAPGVLRLLEEGLPLVLVCENDRLLGAVSRDTVIAELLQAVDEDGDAIGAVLDSGDFALYGDNHPSADFIRVKCAACGAISVVPEFPLPDGICPNGRNHLFIPDWPRAR